MAKLQFIGYQIQTAAEGDTKRRDYPGLTDPRRDIEARCKIMVDAIEAAAASSAYRHVARKIFVAPEFYFRGGRDGAYEIEQVSYVNEVLDGYLSATKYARWIFVLGTALGRMPSDGSGRREIINVALVRKGGVKVTSTGTDANDSLLVYKEYVSAIDFLGPFFGRGNKWFDHATRAGTASLGGAYKRIAGTSGSRSSGNIVAKGRPNLHGQHRTYKPSGKFRFEVNKKAIEGKITPEERDRWLATVDYTTSETSQSGLGGGTNFTMDGMQFVLEICLDHAEERAKNTIPANDVDLHVITSCGMTPSYQWVRTGGYQFAVDGIDDDEDLVWLARKTGSGQVDIDPADTIDMADSGRWRKFSGSGQHLFQGGRGTVLVFPPQNFI
ncbi:hypothetical protein [Haliangium sp.]|uniref:hypothetical protein n=1 Tax=Haliangium sp. TaxID=2663208 RepID=UPI003D0F6BC7